MALSTLKEKLEKKRAGYQQEGMWHRLLLDAYRGSGGFQGSVKQPEAGFWGSAAEAYRGFATLDISGVDITSELDTYVDRFPREDIPKFKRRVQVAHYPNYVKPITNLKISYIVRKPHQRKNVPPKLGEWIDRTRWDDGFRRRALVTAVLGWWNALVDKPRVDPSARTAREAGDVDPYVVMMFPCHTRDYSTDDHGEYEWVKFCIDVASKPTWDSEEKCVKQYTVWTREGFETWHVDESTGATSEPVPTANGAHKFGKVPVVPWRTDASVDDPVKADSINAEIVPEVRRLFNLHSELDEHMRGSVFALLIVPDRGVTHGSENKELGSENGLIVDPEQKNLPFFLAAPAEIAATYETRLEKTIIEIYRMARVEYDRASGTRSNAQSQQQNFQQTNLSIVDFAAALAKADRATLMLVGKALGCSDDELEKMECIPHESYAEAELNDEIEQVIAAVTQLSIGNTAKGQLLKRIIRRLAPGLDASTLKTIDSEIDEAIVKAEKERELTAAALAEGADEEQDDDDGDDDDAPAKPIAGA
jgi:hypothetical protein